MHPACLAFADGPSLALCTHKADDDDSGGCDPRAAAETDDAGKEAAAQILRAQLETQSTELMHGLRYRDADGTSVKRDADGEATASSFASFTTRVEAATRRQAVEQHRAGTTLAAKQRDTREVIRAPGSGGLRLQLGFNLTLILIRPSMPPWSVTTPARSPLPAALCRLVPARRAAVLLKWACRSR